MVYWQIICSIHKYQVATHFIYIKCANSILESAILVSMEGNFQKMPRTRLLVALWRKVEEEFIMHHIDTHFGSENFLKIYNKCSKFFK